jgi:hypothetical protein
MVLLVGLLTANCAGKGGGRSADGQAPSSGTDAVAAVNCPKDPTQVEPCSREGATCKVGSACCECRTLPACGSSPTWNCVTPSTDPGCGRSPPEPASACTQENLRCSYCLGDKPAVRICARGKWVEDVIRICR